MTRSFFPFGAAAGCTFLALATGVIAQEARLEWLPSGASAKFHYYMPQRLTLRAEKPDTLKKAPDSLNSPLYGEISVGPQESPQKIIVLVDQTSDGQQKLWVDTNGNGDLTDDPPAKWQGQKITRNGKESTQYGGTASLQIAYGTEKPEVQIQLYRFDPTQRAEAKTMLLYYRDWGYAGQVVLGDKTYKAMLDDTAATGDFRGKEGTRSGVTLLLDINADGQFDSKTEQFDVRKPFNIAGTTYQVTGLTASGKGLKIIKSDQSVEETKPLAVLATGGKPVPFEAKTTAGQTVRFPEDYKGKVVMLDFWATWCGPCRAELPNVKKVYDEFHAKGFEILGISLDSAESLEKLAKFTKDNDMPWPQICDGKAWDAELAGKYAVRGIPAAFLIDGSGKLTAIGNELRGDRLRPAVESALGGKSISGTPSPSKSPKEAPKAAPRPAEPDPLIAKAEAAQKADKLVSDKAFLDFRKSPVPGPVDLPSVSTQPLSGREVARLARERYINVGWFYHCTRCDHWHLKLCGAYPVANDAIATAWHVTNPPDTLKEGYFVAIDSAQNFLPITGVIAGDPASDTIVIRTKGANLKPLALNDAIEVGDAAFCFSNPLQERNYFSSGIVNRLHLERDNGAKSTAGAPPSQLRLNVSTDWAPGSSGAAVLDACGNIIGHVATINPLFEGNPSAANSGNGPHKEDRFHNAPLMTLHDAIPAKTVRSLLNK